MIFSIPLSSYPPSSHGPLSRHSRRGLVPETVYPSVLTHSFILIHSYPKLELLTDSNSRPLFKTPPPLVFTFHLFLSLVAQQCTGTSVNGFSDWRQSCPTTNLAIQVIHLLLLVEWKYQLLFWDLFTSQPAWQPSHFGAFSEKGFLQICLISNWDRSAHTIISS